MTRLPTVTLVAVVAGAAAYGAWEAVRVGQRADRLLTEVRAGVNRLIPGLIPQPTVEPVDRLPQILVATVVAILVLLILSL